MIVAQIFLDLMRGLPTLNNAFYQLRPDFFTTFGTEAVGVTMIPLIGAMATEKLLFTVVIIGVPLAIISGIYAACRRISPFMLIALPYGYTATLAQGNFNFLLGTILELAIFAAILARPGLPSAGRTIILALCLLLVPLIHPAPTVLILYLAGLLVLGRSLRLWSGGDRRQAVHQFLRYCAAALPALAVLAVFLVLAPTGQMAYQKPPYMRVREFLDQWELYKVGRYEIALALLLSAILSGTACLALWKRRPWRFRDSDWLFVLSIAAFVLYMLSPNKMAGGDAFVARVSVLPWILLLMWLAAQPLPRWVGKTVLVVGLVIQGTFLAGAYHIHAVASADMARYFATANAVPSRAIVLPLIGDAEAHDAAGNALAMRAEPMYHLYNITAIQKADVFLHNWNAHYRIANIEYRPDHDPYPDLSSGAGIVAGLERYTRRTGVLPDGILLWRVAPESKRWAAFKGLLDRAYKPVSMTEGKTVSGYWRRVAQ